MNFAEALLQEEKRLVDVRELPALECPQNATCIGPTKVWFYLDRVVEAPNEAKLLKKWREQDSRIYTHTQMKFWR